MRWRGLREVKKFWRKLNQHGLILMYHRVCEADDTSDPWELCVSPQNFQEHLEVLKHDFEAVRLSDMVRNLSSIPLKHNKVAVTFDDGYSDNFLYAKPLLEQYDIPAAFFIVSGSVGSSREFWWDELERMVLQNPQLPGEVKLHIEGVPIHWVRDDKDPASTVSLFKNLWKTLRGLSESQRGRYLEEIRIVTKGSSDQRRSHLPVTSEQLRQMSASSVCEVGAHTVTHPPLANLESGSQRSEIIDSRTQLQDMLGDDVTIFSYPHGSHTDETVTMVRDAGYGLSCTVEEMTVTRKSDIYRLPRFMVRNWSREEFKQRLTDWITLKG